MKTSTSLALITIVALGVNLKAANLPEFMNSAQLNQWSTEKSAASVSVAQEESSSFYTGKPLVADAGGYVYKYRTYNPEISRWTSTDPSGYPDGVNNSIYANNECTYALDDNGLTLEQNNVTKMFNLDASAFVTSGLNAFNASLISYSGTPLAAAITQSITDQLTSTINTQFKGDKLVNKSATFKGTADFDPSSSAWSNPGLNTDADFSTKININLTVSGIGLTGTIGYSVAYKLSGSAKLQNQTKTSADVVGNFVPTVTATLGLDLKPGGGLTGTGNGLSSAFQVDVPLKE